MNARTRLEREQEVYLNYTSNYLCGTPFSVYRGWPYLLLSSSLVASLITVTVVAVCDQHEQYLWSVSGIMMAVVFDLAVFLVYLFIYHRIDQNEYADRQGLDDSELLLHREERDEELAKKRGKKRKSNPFSHVMKAMISKAPQAMVYFTLLLAWIIYGSIHHYAFLLSSHEGGQQQQQQQGEEEQDSESLSLSVMSYMSHGEPNVLVYVLEHIGISCMVALSYVQRLYNSIVFRMLLTLIYVVSLLCFPTTENVTGGMFLVKMLFRTILFFVLFMMTELEGRCMLKDWMKYFSLLGDRSSTNIVVCLSDELTYTPITEIQTERKKVFFVLYRSVFQSVYVLFACISTEVVFLLFLVHVAFLTSRIVRAFGKMNENVHKKFDDVNVMYQEEKRQGEFMYDREEDEESDDEEEQEEEKYKGKGIHSPFVVPQEDQTLTNPVPVHFHPHGTYDPRMFGYPPHPGEEYYGQSPFYPTPTYPPPTTYFPPEQHSRPPHGYISPTSPDPSFMPPMQDTKEKNRPPVRKSPPVRQPTRSPPTQGIQRGGGGRGEHTHHMYPSPGSGVPYRGRGRESPSNRPPRGLTSMRRRKSAVDTLLRRGPSTRRRPSSRRPLPRRKKPPEASNGREGKQS